LGNLVIELLKNRSIVFNQPINYPITRLANYQITGREARE